MSVEFRQRTPVNTQRLRGKASGSSSSRDCDRDRSLGGWCISCRISTSRQPNRCQAFTLPNSVVPTITEDSLTPRSTASRRFYQSPALSNRYSKIRPLQAERSAARPMEVLRLHAQQHQGRSQHQPQRYYERLQHHYRGRNAKHCRRSMRTSQQVHRRPNADNDQLDESAKQFIDQQVHRRKKNSTWSIKSA